MPLLTSTIKEQANAGDISALLSIHDFCRGYNVRDHATFTSILDIVFHNLRPQLYPDLENVPHFPRASRTWLKAVAISLFTIVGCLDSLIAASGTRTGPVEASFLESIPYASCRRIARKWDYHIWPAISAVTYWYIPDDLQPPISAYIHQDTLHTAISRLFMYIVQDRFEMLAHIQHTPGVASCAARLFVRSVKLYPHPSGVYTGHICNVMESSESFVFKDIRDLGFVPAFLSFLPQQGTQFEESNHECRMALTTAYGAFKFCPSEFVADTATQYPELLNELVRTWEKHRAVHRPVPDHASQSATEEFIHRQTFIMQVLSIIAGLMKHGGYRVQRQGLKQKILRSLVQSVIPDYRSPELASATEAQLLVICSILNILQSSLCYYSVLTVAVYELGVIDYEGSDEGLVNSRAVGLRKLQSTWIEFRRAVEERMVLLADYKVNALQDRAFCSMKSLCPKDVQDGSYKCSICKATYYCSRRCQKQHWNQKHKQDCKPFAEEYQPDEREMDFLEYQLTYDLEEIWSYTFTNPSNIPISSASNIVCNYNRTPPQVILQPADWQDLVENIQNQAGPGEGPDYMFMMIMIPHIQPRIMVPYSWIDRALVVAAITPGSEMPRREKGARLVEIRGKVFLD